MERSLPGLRRYSRNQFCRWKDGIMSCGSSSTMILRESTTTAQSSYRTVGSPVSSQFHHRRNNWKNNSVSIVLDADGSVCAFPTILASAELQLPSLNVPRPVFTAAPSPPPARQPSASPPARQPAASLPARKPGRPMKRTISESEMVTCSDCSKVFSGPKPLALHKRERCGKDGVKDYECGRCKKKFAYKSTVRRHEVKCRVWVMELDNLSLWRALLLSSFVAFLLPGLPKIFEIKRICKKLFWRLPFL